MSIFQYFHFHEFLYSSSNQGLSHTSFKYPNGTEHQNRTHTSSCTAEQVWRSKAKELGRGEQINEYVGTWRQDEAGCLFMLVAHLLEWKSPKALLAWWQNQIITIFIPFSTSPSSFCYSPDLWPDTSGECSWFRLACLSNGLFIICSQLIL